MPAAGVNTSKFRVAADERRAAWLAEGATYRMLDRALDRPSIAEPHLCLGRVNVHVDGIGRQHDLEEQ